MTHERQLIRRIRFATGVFIGGLVASGLTAIPLETELALLDRWIGGESGWVHRVATALHETNMKHPFLAYGTDWLAFGHMIIALAFVWAWRDPVRNRWMFDFGLLACALVVPWALVSGEVRGIPMGWRLIDCGFGLLGAVPMGLCRKWAAIAVARAA